MYPSVPSQLPNVQLVAQSFVSEKVQELSDLLDVVKSTLKGEIATGRINNSTERNNVVQSPAPSISSAASLANYFVGNDSALEIYVDSLKRGLQVFNLSSQQDKEMEAQNLARTLVAISEDVKSASQGRQLSNLSNANSASVEDQAKVMQEFSYEAKGILDDFYGLSQEAITQQQYQEALDRYDELGEQWREDDLTQAASELARAGNSVVAKVVKESTESLKQTASLAMQIADLRAESKRDQIDTDIKILKDKKAQLRDASEKLYKIQSQGIGSILLKGLGIVPLIQMAFYHAKKAGLKLDIENSITNIERKNMRAIQSTREGEQSRMQSAADLTGATLNTNIVTRPVIKGATERAGSDIKRIGEGINVAFGQRATVDLNAMNLSREATARRQRESSLVKPSYVNPTLGRQQPWGLERRQSLPIKAISASQSRPVSYAERLKQNVRSGSFKGI